MAVYQPNAVLGNSRTLVTMGAAGEIMTFFYPHIDFPQNVYQGMPAVYLGTPGHGEFTWTYESCWQAKQEYVPRRNILVTTLTHAGAGLELTITDLVHPERDIFWRHFSLKNVGNRTSVGTLMQYLALRLGEIPRKNSARRREGSCAIIQYWRHMCFAMGGDCYDSFAIGKIGAGNSARQDMLDGALNNQREELGDVDTAYAWYFELAPGQELTRDFIISAGQNETKSLDQLHLLEEAGFASVYAETDNWWGEWLNKAVPVALEPLLTETYYRSLLATRLLYDERYGSFLAAPEFDPMFERCGGYGFVWPRDAAEVVLALELAGFPDMVGHFFDWAKLTQHATGYWDQRYWSSGEVGPGWCSFLDSIQIDQTGSMVYALGAHEKCLPHEHCSEFRQRYWAVTENACDYLLAALGENGLHEQAFDLWEKFLGSFTYSNASIYAALNTGAAWAAARHLDGRATEWTAAAERIKAKLLRDCWNGEYFARGYDAGGNIDWGVDSSMLGVFDPFGMITLEVPEECAMVESMVHTVRTRLTKQLHEGEAIIRHEGDDYVDGSAGGVNTLWLARVMLRLALHFRDIDVDKSEAYRTDAEKYLRTVIARGTDTLLLPELIGSDTTPRWAVPHGWAMSSYVQCALLLEELKR